MLTSSLNLHNFGCTYNLKQLFYFTFDILQHVVLNYVRLGHASSDMQMSCN